MKLLALLLCAAGCSLGSFNDGALACGPDDGGPVCPSGTSCYCNVCAAAQPAGCCVPETAAPGGLTPRYGLALVYVQEANYLLAIGGFDSCGQPSSLVEVYGLTASSGWLPAVSSIGTTDLPTPAGYLGAAALGTAGAVIVAGGQGPGGVLLSSVEINPFTPPAWGLAANLPGPLAQPAMALNVFDGCVYVVGGVEGSGSPPEQSSTIEQLCSPLQAGATWSSVGTFSCNGISAACPISGAAAVYSPFDQNIYVLGGFSGGSTVSTVELVAPGGGVSLLGGLTNSGHVNGGAAFAGPSSLYVMGGLPAPGQPPITEVETLDLSEEDGGWSPVSPLQLPLSDFGAASDSQGNLYVVGGRTVAPDGGWQVVGTTEVYGTASGTWNTVP